jgi:hypothetical protein
MAGLGRLAIPFHRLGAVLLDPLAVLIGIAQPVLGIEVALAGGRLVKRRRLPGIGLDPVAALMHQARQAILRLDIALIGRPAVPFGGLDQVDVGASSPSS